MLAGCFEYCDFLKIQTSPTQSINQTGSFPASDSSSSSQRQRAMMDDDEGDDESDGGGGGKGPKPLVMATIEQMGALAIDEAAIR